MMITSIIISIMFILVNSQSETSNQIICSTIDQTTNKGVCLLAPQSNDKNYYIFDPSVCGNEQVCDNTNFKNKNSMCTGKIKGFQGEACTADSDCLSMVCDSKNKVCSSLANNAPCTDTIQCAPGFFCGSTDATKNTTTCIQQLSSSAVCNSEGISPSYQCNNNQLCFSNKCVDYFSQENNQDVSTIALLYYDPRYICKSSFTVMTDDNKKICYDPTNVIVQSSGNYCFYNDTKANKTYQNSSFSEDPFGIQVCPLADPNDAYYKSAVAYARYYFPSSEILNINAAERYRHPRELYIHLSQVENPVRRSKHNCAQQFLTFGKAYNKPKNEKCPVVKCTKSSVALGDECLSSKSNIFTISTCDSTKEIYCPKNKFNETGTESISSQKCEQKSVLKSNFIDNFECNVNSHCASGNCANKKCVGKVKGTSCASDFECAAGTYCDNSSKQCTDLVAINGKCFVKTADSYVKDKKFTYDNCLNSVCLNELCVVPFSIQDGSPGVNGYVKNTTYSAGSSHFCASGYSDANGLCSSLFPVVYFDSSKKLFNFVNYDYTNNKFGDASDLQCSLSSNQYIKPNVISPNEGAYQHYKKAINAYLSGEAKNKNIVTKYDFSEKGDLQFLNDRFFLYPAFSEDFTAEDLQCFGEYYGAKEYVGSSSIVKVSVAVLLLLVYNLF